MWAIPLPKSKPAKSENPSLKIKAWGLKWSSSPTSMLKIAFDLKDYHLRSHHVGHSHFKIQTSKIQNPSLKTKAWGLKWSSSPTSTLKFAFDLTDYHLRPHQVGHTPSKIQTHKISKSKLENQSLGSRMEFINNFNVEICI